MHCQPKTLPMKICLSPLKFRNCDLSTDFPSPGTAGIFRTNISAQLSVCYFLVLHPRKECEKDRHPAKGLQGQPKTSRPRGLPELAALCGSPVQNDNVEPFCKGEGKGTSNGTKVSDFSPFFHSCLTFMLFLFTI